jgi:hypothetical protein
MQLVMVALFGAVLAGGGMTLEIRKQMDYLAHWSSRN